MDYQSILVNVNKNTITVSEWPERARIRRNFIMADIVEKILDLDENVAHFTVDNGIARYYRVKGIEDDNFIYLKKFYSFSFRME